MPPVEAESEYSMDPEVLQVIVEKAQESLESGNLEQAEKWLARAVRLAPQTTPLLSGYGSVLLARGKLDEAAEVLLMVIQLDPQDVQALVSLAAIRKSQGRNAEAAELARRAKRIAPDNEQAQVLEASLRNEPAPRHPDLRILPQPPTVSVILPTYNRLGMLPIALQSLADQTWKDFEVVVVNDAGEDIGAVVAPFLDKLQITTVRLGQNRGIGAVLNTGIRMARGKYIAYLADDDFYHANHLEILVAALESGQYEVAYTDSWRSSQRLENGKYVIYQRELIYSQDFNPDLMLLNNYIPAPCIMHTRKAIDEVGWYDEELTVYEDWDLWIRMSRKFPFLHIPTVTCEVTWRTDGSTMTSSRRGFQTLFPYLYDRYAEYAQDKPEVLRLQNERRAIIERNQREAKAVEWMNRCLEAEDILGAIRASAAEIDPLILELLESHIRQCVEAGEQGKAEFLYRIRNEIQKALRSYQVLPGLPPAEERFQMLLESPDLVVALGENEDWLDEDLLRVVDEHLGAARREGLDELAGGLGELAEYIRSVMAINAEEFEPTAVPV